VSHRVRGESLVGRTAHVVNVVCGESGEDEDDNRGGEDGHASSCSDILPIVVG